MRDSTSKTASIRVRWARLRFAIIGPLLAAPPKSGALKSTLKALSEKTWRHPVTGDPIQFGVSTLERWFYQARREANDPIQALARKIHKNAGHPPSINEVLQKVMHDQYRDHPTWSYQLHYDNFLALEKKDASLGVPSYPTVRRYMKAQGLHKRKRTKGKGRKESEAFEAREKRSFEVYYVHALWHSDFHEAKRKVLTSEGVWEKPVLFGMLDDRSRLCCHLQWYTAENAQCFVHGLSQAFLKRGLPRKLLTDNGKAMLAKEVEEGLSRLSVLHDTTLPYTPEQNAKQEVFWAQIEGRLMPMLEKKKALTLALLNRATQAWVELEYNRKKHSEIGEAPTACLLREKSVGRPPPESEHLKRVFRMETLRKQRTSDGTISVEGKRFEIPTPYRSLMRPTIRYARWDLSHVALVDPRTGQFLTHLLPLDKQKNADRKRRLLGAPHSEEHRSVEVENLKEDSDGHIAPHLKQLMEDYERSGLPPAYIPLLDKENET